MNSTKLENPMCINYYCLESDIDTPFADTLMKQTPTQTGYRDTVAGRDIESYCLETVLVQYRGLKYPVGLLYFSPEQFTNPSFQFRGVLIRPTARLVECSFKSECKFV